MADTKFSGATTESAMAGQAPQPLKNGFTDVGHPPPHRATEPAEPQSGRRDESIPVTRGNQHLVIGSDLNAVEASPRDSARERRTGLADRRGSGLAATAPVKETPEFEPGKPPPRTDADADPHTPSTPGFQGLAPLPERLAATAAERADLANAPAEASAAAPAESLALKQGHLPEEFPGYSALDAAGEATYTKVRKRIVDGTLTEIPGIGEATADRIKEEMTAS